MPLLTQDKTWWRFHEESALLSRLLEYDYQLLFQTDAVGQKTRLLTADDWQAGMAQAQFNGLLGPLDSLIYGRQQLLSGM